MKLVGEKAIGPFLVDVEKDALNMAKIRECCEKAVIQMKVSVMKKDKSSSSVVKTNAQSKDESTKRTTSKTVISKQAKKPGSGGKKYFSF